MENSQANIQLEMNFNTPSGNRFRRCLDNGVFTVLFEHAAPGMELDDNDAAMRLAELEKIVLASREVPAALALTDRSFSDNARRAVDYATLLPEKNRNSHLIYLSGRNSSPATVQSLIAQAKNSNLANIIAVSGDSRLNEGCRDLKNMEFCESINTLRFIHENTTLQDFFAGATVNAHLSSAPALYSAMFKLIKKFNCGAEFAVTQAGFDMAQLDALRRYLTWRGYHQPLIARLILLTPERVEKIIANALPGITISQDFLMMLEKELRFSASQFEAAQYRRLELQAAGCKLLGYSGIQIFGADTPSKMHIALERVGRALKEFTNLKCWEEEYKFYIARSDIAPADQHFYLFEDLLQGMPPENSTHALTEFRLPRQSFKSKLGDRARRFFFPDAGQQDAGERRWLKKLLAGCQSCENCRLPETQFYCPERCPKRLANGVCGGVRSNGECEVGNMPCVHVQIWHAAERNRQSDTLENKIIESGKNS
ncbi:MAG: methylenetetrahydrofolate reductase C-terminal domain-containing protein [Lentisphaeria bacterium]|nr:methylenetetrahydrofolate reductase C-terminal domain-containing protein [Lentisphaeria bacterium]